MSRVFVSYSHQDVDLASRLEQALKDARVPVWRDQEGIHPGAVFRPVLERGLAQATVVLVIVSRASARSEWVAWETGEALARRVRVIPVLIDGTKPAGPLGALSGVDLHDWRAGQPHAGLNRLISTLREDSGGRGWQITRLAPGRLEVALDHQRHILEVHQGQLFVDGRSTGAARPVVTNERQFVFQLQDGNQFYPAELIVQISMLRGDPKKMTLTVAGRTIYQG